jgi:hypothetical protein
MPQILSGVYYGQYYSRFEFLKQPVANIINLKVVFSFWKSSFPNLNLEKIILRANIFESLYT